MDPWILLQKLPNFLAAMNGGLVPNQDDGATHASQQLSQEVNDLVTCQVALIRFGTQSNGAFTGRDQQRCNGIDPFMVLNARLNLGCLASWRPRSLERTDQRLPIFIDKDKGCIQVMPLFLSLAKYSASSARSRRRHVGKRRAAAFDNSTPCAVGDTTPHWRYTAHQIAAQLTARRVPRSNNLRHSRKQTRLSTKSALAVSTVAVLNDMADKAVATSVCAWYVAVTLPAASVARCGASHVQRLRPVSCYNLVVVDLMRVLGARPPVRLFQ